MQLYLRIFGLLEKEVLKIKITDLMVCGYWVVMGLARETRESEWTKVYVVLNCCLLVFERNQFDSGHSLLIAITQLSTLAHNPIMSQEPVDILAIFVLFVVVYDN
ncbi:hypothetical protein H5410_030888 [Solanum commersonii]|uniref:Uncharacterized protein n=1 Tax=Solanum commersonii TaxID=4109 RepID=A0A9J5YKN5_SOLCO|nr:hypothetical protein H5410_030888 [Solanum commersonii]